MAKVTVLQDHTLNGETHIAGETYDAPDELIDTLTVQGKAILSRPLSAEDVARAFDIPVDLISDVAPKTPKAKKG